MTNTPILRLTQTVEQADTYHIAVELTGAGPRITASAHFTFELSEQERQDIRWCKEPGWRCGWAWSGGCRVV